MGVQVTLIVIKKAELENLDGTYRAQPCVCH